MNRSSRSAKVLAPLAVLLAAGALAVGSGATFTSTTGNTISSVTAGSLELKSSNTGAIFSAANMKPKDVVSGQVTITNDGSLPATLSLTETDDTNAFGANLQMVVTNVTDNKTVYTGTFGGLTSADLGQLDAGASKTLSWTVTLDAATGNEFQGKAAQAAYTWDAVQLNP